MEFLTNLNKKKRIKNPKKYKIDWESDSRSKFQTAVKRFLQPFWLYDQVYEEFPVAGSRLTFDFYNHTKNVVVEVNGIQHYKYSKFMHGKSKMNFLKQIKRDEEKLAFCERNDIILIEVACVEEISLEFFAERGAI